MTDRLTDPHITPMFQSERQREIVALTLKSGRVEVAELSDRFGVTTETVRRDLSDLQKQRVVRRVHGGAVPWEKAGFEPLLSVRNDLQDGEKRRLAQRAIEELPDTGSIIIDSGSTLLRLAATIPPTCELRIVTNSLAIAQVLADHKSGDVIVIGGKVRKNTLAMVDADAVAAVEPLTVDTLFISSDALSPDVGLTTPYREEAALKSAMIRSARRVVALVDHSKVGGDQFIRFAKWSDIDVLVTNTEVDPRVVQAIEAAGTTVLLADVRRAAHHLELVAVDVAIQAARLVADASGSAAAARTKSSPTDVVTHTDLQSESLIRRELLARCPGSAIVGEEYDDGVGTNHVGWIVDPIDGTVNFLYDLPVVAVSIAATIGGHVVAGAVADVHRRETFSASVDGGARCNGEPIRASVVDDLGQALVGTGFAYDSALRAEQAEVIADVLPVCRDIRCMGSAALNLCWIGCGRLDAYFERDLKVYDHAAGALIAARAGAVVDQPRDSDLITASAPGLDQQFRSLVGSSPR